MTGLTLRPYQQEAVDAVEAAWAGGMSRPAVVLPTGTGKTCVFADLIRRAHLGRALQAGHRERRGAAVVLVHRDELVHQAVSKISSVMLDTEVGVVKAERDDPAAPVIVASVQTLARPTRIARLLATQPVSLVVADEAHHYSSRTYREVLEGLGAFDGRAKAVGFTATMSRADNGKLGDVWQQVVYTQDILWGIEHGYLSDVRGRQVTVDDLDLDGVTRTRGDYADGALGGALVEAGAGAVIAQAYLEHASDRQGVVFCPTVACAQEVAAEMVLAGIAAELVVGTTPLDIRRRIYAAQQAGAVQVLVSVGVLTEGWDAPWVSCAVIARPTSSTGLYVQMVGRVLRPWPGKVDALVLDVVGVSSRLKLAGISNLSTTDVEVADGQSLIEARKQAERGADEEQDVPETARTPWRYRVGATEVDLFHTSVSAWLNTPAGVWFITTRTSTWFLWPDADDPSLWRIGKCGIRSAKGGQWVMTGLTLGYARAWAEQRATEEDPSIASRTSSWRRGRPSEAQVSFANRLGLPVEVTELRRGALSDAISVHFASKILDKEPR